MARISELLQLGRTEAAHGKSYHEGHGGNEAHDSLLTDIRSGTPLMRPWKFAVISKKFSVWFLRGITRQVSDLWNRKRGLAPVHWPNSAEISLYFPQYQGTSAAPIHANHVLSICVASGLQNLVRTRDQVAVGKSPEARIYF